MTLAFLGNAPAVVLLGVVSGLQYAMLAVGLVLVYKSARFVNFTHGQLGLVAASLLAKMVLEWDVPYLLALPVVLMVAGGTGAVVERLVIQRLFSASKLSLLLATIGVSQILFVLNAVGPFQASGAVLVREGYPVPFDLSWSVGPLVLVSSQIVTLVVAPALALGLTLFFTRSATGKAIRAAASNPEAARLAGISVRRISLMVWVTAGVLSGVTAILLAPTQPTIDLSILGPGLLLRGLAAALVGGLTSLPIAFAAGIGVGIVEQSAFWNFGGGVTDLAVLGVVLVTIVVRRRELAAAAAGTEVTLAAERSTPPLTERLRARWATRSIDRVGWVALAVGGLVLPLLPGLRSQEKAVLLVLLVAYGLVALSLSLLTGWSGQVSMGHFALLGLGAYEAALAAERGWAMPAVMVEAGAVSALAAVAIGLPALRFRGLVLAVSTLAFALAGPSWLFRQDWISEGSTGNAALQTVRVPGIGTIDTPRGLYFFALATLAIVVVALRFLRDSGAGRAIIAVRDSERTAAAHGLTPARVKVATLALSGFITGVAGALWAAAIGNWSFQAFSASTSLVMLAAAIVGGLGTLHGPLLGTLAVWAWPFFVPDANTLTVRAVSSGALLLVVLLAVPDGLAGLVTRFRTFVLRRVDPSYGATDGDGPAEGAVDPRLVDLADVDIHPGVEPELPDPDRPLVVEGAAIAFGGVRAVDGANLEVRPGEIVGLIGGNGAGKSTLLALVSGHLRPDAGSVVIHGRDVTRLAPEYRPWLGVARSFQDAHLYPGLTVLETVMVAIDRTDPGGLIVSMSAMPWGRLGEWRKRVRALRALREVGLADRADAHISELSTGMRRLCDLACVIAARPRLVLLDEPTAGIAQREVEAFADVIRSLRDDLGCAVLIIEHDMPMLMGLCDRLYALEAGKVISEGTPAEVRSDPAVIASYLGTDEAAIARSGGTGAGAAGATEGSGPTAGSGPGATKTRSRKAAPARRTGGGEATVARRRGRPPRPKEARDK